MNFGKWTLTLLISVSFLFLAACDKSPEEKAKEAEANLKKLCDGANAFMQKDQYYPRDHEKEGFPVPPDKKTFPLSEKGVSTHKAVPSDSKEPPNADFTEQIWKELSFSLSEPTYYQYEYSSSGSGNNATYTVIARGDLDGNGTESKFTYIGSVKDGWPSCSPLKDGTDPEKKKDQPELSKEILADYEQWIHHHENFVGIVERTREDCDKMGDELAEFMEKNEEDIRNVGKRLSSVPQEEGPKYAARVQDRYNKLDFKNSVKKCKGHYRVSACVARYGSALKGEESILTIPEKKQKTGIILTKGNFIRMANAIPENMQRVSVQGLGDRSMTISLMAQKNPQGAEPYVRVEVGKCDYFAKCQKIDLDTWKRNRKKLLEVEARGHLENPDLIFEIDETEISGQKVIVLYILSAFEKKNSVNNKHYIQLYFNDGINYIEVNVSNGVLSILKSAEALVKRFPKAEMLAIGSDTLKVLLERYNSLKSDAEAEAKPALPVKMDLENFLIESSIPGNWMEDLIDKKNHRYAHPFDSGESGIMFTDGCFGNCDTVLKNFKEMYSNPQALMQLRFAEKVEDVKSSEVKPGVYRTEVIYRKKNSDLLFKVIVNSLWEKGWSSAASCVLMIDSPETVAMEDTLKKVCFNMKITPKFDNGVAK